MPIKEFDSYFDRFICDLGENIEFEDPTSLFLQGIEFCILSIDNDEIENLFQLMPSFLDVDECEFMIWERGGRTVEEPGKFSLSPFALSIP